MFYFYRDAFFPLQNNFSTTNLIFTLCSGSSSNLCSSTEKKNERRNQISSFACLQKNKTNKNAQWDLSQGVTTTGGQHYKSGSNRDETTLFLRVLDDL